MIDPASLRIAPLTREHAEDLVTWRYDPPYDVYDLTGADPDELLHPALGFHAVLAGERLIGFRLIPEHEVSGIDLAIHGETAYDFHTVTGGRAGGHGILRSLTHSEED